MVKSGEIASKLGECDFLAISESDIEVHNFFNKVRQPTVERGGVFDEQAGRI
jgi:hypothetical protein